MGFAFEEDTPDSFELTFRQVAPLFESFESYSVELQAAALRALVHLPLDREAWRQVSRAAGELIDDAQWTRRTVGGQELNPHIQELLDLAALIPTVSMRNRLYTFLGNRAGEDRRAVAEALVKAGDPAGLPVLMKTAGDTDVYSRQLTAELASRVSVEQVVEQMADWLRAETDPDTRFWLALALARQDQADEFVALAHDLSAGRVRLQASAGDPLYLLSRIERGGPLPDIVLNRLAAIPGAEEHPLLAGLLETGRAVHSPPAQPQMKPELALSPQQVEELAAQIIDESGADLYSGLNLLSESIDQLYRLAPDRASALANTLFFRLAESNAPGGAGNPVVDWVAQLEEPFRPDFPGLFEAYRRAEGNYYLRQQIAWAAGRGSLSGLVSSLSEAFISPDLTLRTDAFRFLADAGQAAYQADPPFFGAGGSTGGSRPGTLSAAGELIEDVPSGLIDPFTVERWEGDSDLDGSGFEKGVPPARQHGNPPSKSGKRRRKRAVNQGLAGFDNPGKPLTKDNPLLPGASYWFWLDIGRPSRASIGPAVEIPDDVPTGAVLTVVLYGFQDELVLDPRANTGRLEILPDGQVVVETQPLGEGAPRARQRKRRLFFPVKTPPQAGIYRMRCNLYYHKLLIQSWLVSAQVGEDMQLAQPLASAQPALSSRLDYKLASALSPVHLNKLPEHDLSILLNRNQDGTHSFHIFGTEEPETVSFGEGELGGMLEQARGTLRLAAWKNTQEWQPGVQFAYQDRRRDLARLKGDLKNLALWGFAFYDKIISRLAGGEAGVEKLEELLRKPGMLQLALKESPSYILPAALIYDAPLDTGADIYTFCPAFEQAFNQSQPLEETDCFQGNCPSYGQDTVICPSGFWGFRHALGMPLSLAADKEVAVEISYQDRLRMVVGYASDLTFYKEHTGALKSLNTAFDWKTSDLRDELLEWMKAGNPHLVYFYCHGGLVREQPYLQIGQKTQPGRIMTSNFRAKRIRWDAPRPLVFINGCHTTSVEPRQALEFISPLVSYSHSAGVIGTEITIYEELAGDFASAFFRRFLAEVPAGEAVRLARLELLSAGNPLGLVYIPFLLAGLKLVHR